MLFCEKYGNLALNNFFIFFSLFCAPLDASDEFTITVGEQKFMVSAVRLKQVSPVFRAMLTDEMREKADRKVEIKETDPEEFRCFLEAISLDQTILPNRQFGDFEQFLFLF